jgi:hypothetical protein
MHLGQVRQDQTHLTYDQWLLLQHPDYWSSFLKMILAKWWAFEKCLEVFPLYSLTSSSLIALAFVNELSLQALHPPPSMLLPTEHNVYNKTE